MEKIQIVEIRKEVISLLRKLASGWRQPQWERSQNIKDWTSSELLEQYKIHGFRLIWSTDVLKENSTYIQILKVWDVLPSLGVPKLAKHIETILRTYTMDKLNCCKKKYFEGYTLFYTHSVNIFLL